MATSSKGSWYADWAEEVQKICAQVEAADSTKNASAITGNQSRVVG